MVVPPPTKGEREVLGRGHGPYDSSWDSGANGSNGAFSSAEAPTATRTSARRTVAARPGMPGWEKALLWTSAITLLGIAGGVTIDQVITNMQHSGTSHPAGTGGEPGTTTGTGTESPTSTPTITIVGEPVPAPEQASSFTNEFNSIPGYHLHAVTREVSITINGQTQNYNALEWQDAQGHVVVAYGEHVDTDAHGKPVLEMTFSQTLGPDGKPIAGADGWALNTALQQNAIDYAVAHGLPLPSFDPAVAHGVVTVTGVNNQPNPNQWGTAVGAYIGFSDDGGDRIIDGLT
ncbi:MAG: hypothetical protein ACREGI_01300, partial [Candidatus Levyibacteriota bacterium]